MRFLKWYREHKRISTVKLVCCIIFAIIVILVITIGGCSIKADDDEKIKDIEFTVVPERDIPQELLEIINESKDKVIKKTFTDQESLYIVVGYGAQPTTGYSISVKELYEAKSVIYIKTWLIGPLKSEKTSSEITYPYVVLKIENTDKRVVFR